MKKVVLLFSAVVLIAGLTFAQTPQEKSTKPAPKTENVSKDSKSGCDMKDKAACTHSKDAKGCCAKDGKKATPATTTPEKK